ncbi:MAG TPA: N-acetylmuramic acid 6-phosphate etherase [Candidatus Dormibacteraeota bacterium]|nr:N-acetylmuramic acid 6-phosphate etherase [Candidatus Dormibacteraeota bacterium]
MSEEVHPRADELDAMSSLELVSLMQEEDARAVRALEPQLENIARAVDAIAAKLRGGGRMHYFGAGTSGLIAAMDAFECSPTFGVDVVRAHVVTEAGQEDDSELGEKLAHEAGLRRGDVAVGVSASGRTAFVLGALAQAAQDGAVRIAITCRPESQLGRLADVAIEVETGPEVIAGSTRLKAGTVQKLVLNMLSTGVFTRLGRTHRGRMVSVVPGNAKRRERAARMIADLAGVTIEEARRRLHEAGGDVAAALAAERRA